MEGFVNSLSHQHCSLLEIQPANNVLGSSVFNTVVSLRSRTEIFTSEDVPIKIEQEGGYNTTEIG
jgi:hypothetical protein